MNRKNTIPIMVGALILGLASAAWAGIPDPDNSTAVTAATEDVSILICPACDGDPFTNARLYGGGTTDATITVTLLDVNFIPVANYPAEDVYMTANGICCCEPPFHCHAAYDSDPNGQTIIVGPICAGGCSNDNSTTIWIGPDPLTQPPLPFLSYNSPDMNCDLVVNLTDVVLFAQILLIGPYDYCADFFWDGTLNLSDVVFMAQHIGHVCPN